jgi:ketosteroid isomerase-like protein
MNTVMPEVGKTSSLSALRDYLQEDCNMLQVWGGMAEGHKNYQVYLSEDLKYFCVIESADEAGEMFVISIGGHVTYVHAKNLLKIRDFTN